MTAFLNHHPLRHMLGLPGGSVVRNLSVNVRYPLTEPRVQSLGWEDPLEKEMTTHSSVLAWETPRTEEPGGLHKVHGVTESRT